MGTRKKRVTIHEAFDPTISDSDDENFEPGGPSPGRQPTSRHGRKKPRTSIKKTSARRKNASYQGSDIDSDDGEVLSDTDDSFGDAGNHDDEDLGETATGRKRRRAAVTHSSYKEESGSDDVSGDDIKHEDDEDEPQGRKKTTKKERETGSENEQDQPQEQEQGPQTGLQTDPEQNKEQSSAPEVTPKAGEGVRGGEDQESEPQPHPRQNPTRNSRIVTLQVPAAKRTRLRAEPNPPPSARRATRARTAELEGGEDLVELSSSGRHAIRASKSPDPAPRRPTRSAKGLKAPPTIDEATQESGSPEKPPQADVGDEDIPMVTGDIEMPDASGDENQNENDTSDEKVQSIEVDDNDDDDDDIPLTRRTRSRRSPPRKATANVQAEAEDGDADAEQEAEADTTTRGGRLTRARKAKRMRKPQDASSDFEPGNDSDASGAVAASETSDKSPDADEDDEEGESSSRSRTRRSTRSKKRSREESADEVELDAEEMQEELHELRNTRPRRRRSPSIQYEPVSKRRRTTRDVNYAIQSIPALVPADDEDDIAIQTPARGGAARRGGRNGGGGWDRMLNTTYGPFGGGGMPSILGGPWGTGATGGVESDSSDDEIPEPVNKTGGGGGGVGMTPTTANAPAFLPGGAGPAAGATPNLGKVKNQKQLADADPLGVDMNVDFSKVGGLQGHIDQLKEMVQLPLLYPELFMKFHVTPPRGVLFHGPPGTGKTLLARALANSIGHNGKKITFYMRKGADALSKWVGEAEKQLRLLFEEARKNQPSIIFFDEIDGLAPVRSSKQEQIHASIVSTLLALMDGMDGRGQVIVIGATNRPDNIDPALRRPGRFDREFYFPLPDFDARLSILDINTRDWGLSPEFKKSLAERTKGYGGADLRSLCTEAALNSIQRSYPQIYSSKDKLIVDATKITIHATDFSLSIKKMVPSSERSASSGASAIPKSVRPLLNLQLEDIKAVIDNVLPRKKKTTALEEAMFEPYDDEDHGFGREAMQQEFERARIFRPRLLIGGRAGMGQNYISSALLHYLEGVNVQKFDLATLLADGQPPETVMVRLFAEVKRNKPSVIHIPDVDVWYASLASSSALLAFKTMLRSLTPTDPILVLGTCECELNELPPEALKDLFGFSKKSRVEISRPTVEQRREYFSGLLQYMKKAPTDYPDAVNRKKRVLDSLPIAPPPPPKERTKEEIKADEKADRQSLNWLKVQLQPIMDQIHRRYKKMRNPVIPFASLDYLFAEHEAHFVRADVAHPEQAQQRPYEIVQDKDGSKVIRETATGKTFFNLETTTIEERLSNGFYARPKDFLKDIVSLTKDAKNIGDRERTLKANELQANVEVDVGGIEINSKGYDWDALYIRQRDRAKAKEEKARKKKTSESMRDPMQGDSNANGSDSNGAGPILLGAPVPGSRTTTARFLPIGDSPVPEAGNADAPSADSGSAHPLTNGTSVPSRPSGEAAQDEDTQMTDSLMGPPSQWPRIHGGLHGRALDHSVRATAGNTQVSQRSALMSLPPGVDPTTIENDASTTTTKPSDNQSHRTSENWTQVTNGYVPNVHSNPSQFSPEQSNSQIPDTQPVGRGISSQDSDELWPHSQALGQGRGALPLPHSFGGVDGSPTRSPQQRLGATQRPMIPLRPGETHAAPTMANLLNAPLPEDGDGTPTLRQQQMQQQQVPPQSSQRRNDPPNGSGNGLQSSSLVHLPGDTSLVLPSSNSTTDSSSLLHPRNSTTSSSMPLYVMNEPELDRFADVAAEKTHDCTVEQLEQINRELMDVVWAHRGEWNRMRTLQEVTIEFNRVMGEMEEEGFWEGSQGA